MLDLTLVSCNYNTPLQIEAMLKSWKVNNSEVSNKCLIMEHSTDNESVPFLESNNIPYIRNKGAVHFKGVEVSFHVVNTRYMLLVDSDVIFNKSLYDVLEGYIKSNIHLAGRVEGDRGGFLLHKRVHPWYCFIDLEFVNNNSIRFVDMVRIRNTKSEGFYKNIPFNEFQSTKKYDVGSTFLEDVMKAGGRVLNHNIEGEYFTHFEGMSWRKNSNVKTWIEAANEVDKQFAIASAKYSNVNLKGFFNEC